MLTGTPAIQTLAGYTQIASYNSKYRQI